MGNVKVTEIPTKVTLVMYNQVELIQNLKRQIEAFKSKIQQLESENKLFIEVKTQKEMAEEDVHKLKQELLDVKVEYNKLKTICNSDILNNYEKSLKDANSKLTEAHEKMLKLQENHQEELEKVKSQV